MSDLENKFCILVALILAFLFCLAFLKIHIKIETTMLGYEIGRLKNEEFLLLKKRSSLTMDLAQITTKASLSALSE